MKRRRPMLMHKYETEKSKSKIDTGIFFPLEFCLLNFSFNKWSKAQGQARQKLTTTLPI